MGKTNTTKAQMHMDKEMKLIAFFPHGNSPKNYVDSDAHKNHPLGHSYCAWSSHDDDIYSMHYVES